MDTNSNKKTLIIIAPQGFQDQEYQDTKDKLEKAGIEVKVGSLKLGEAVGKYGARAQIDLLVQNADPLDFDAVAFIGGAGMVELVANQELIDLARKFYQAEKITAAICIAPVILAKAGLLAGKKATVWPGAQDELTKAGANYTGKPVEVDGLLVTGNGPDAAKAFGQAITNGLK